jgi:hypothetical protein
MKAAKAARGSTARATRRLQFPDSIVMRSPSIASTMPT